MIARTDLRAPALGLLAAGALLPMLGHPGFTCPLRATTGIPCPLCGMSTSVQSTVRGRWSDAIAANPMGLVVVAAALAVLIGVRFDLRRIPTPVIVGVLVLMWFFQLTRFSVI